MKKRVKEWINLAKLDLDSAEKLMEDPGLTPTAAFHCQQCAEKLLKAIIEKESGKVPRIHDLGKLYGLTLEYNYKLTIDENTLDELNDVYVETRYPADIGLIPEGIPKSETVDRFISFSFDLYNQVLKII